MRQLDDTDDELCELACSIDGNVNLLQDQCREHTSWIQDIGARFRIWLKVSGVLYSGRASLAHRLRLHEVGFLVVRNLLGILDANIKVFCHSIGLKPIALHDNRDDQAAEPGAEDVDDDDDSPIDPASITMLTRDRIDEDLGRLIAYTGIINEQSRMGRTSEMDSFDPRSPPDENPKAEPQSLMPSFIEYTQLAIERIIGPKQWLDLRKSRPLFTERLTKTIIRRWKHISYRISRTRDKEERQESQAGLDVKRTSVTKSSQSSLIERPITISPTSQANPRARLVPISEGSTLQPNAKLSPANKSSAPRTATIANHRTLDFPIKPAMRPIKDDGREFYCGYCNQLVQVTKVKDEAEAWQQHLMFDFRPYICPYEQCDDSLVMYATFREWNEHMEVNHEEFVWYCSHCEMLDSPSETFLSEEAFWKHMKSNHSGMVADTLPVYRPALWRACDICGKPDEEIARNMPAVSLHSKVLKCMARHLTEFALLSLPWHFETNEYRGSNEAQEDTRRDDMSLDSGIDAKGREQTAIIHSPNESLAILKTIKQIFPDEQGSLRRAEEWRANVTDSDMARQLRLAGVPGRIEADPDLSRSTNVRFSKDFTREDYTIVWISTLGIELAVAQALLDERHKPLPVALGDNNTYTLGRIGEHNIVIVGPESGFIGTTSAAGFTLNLIRSFPNIRFGLMVGVGGGVPPDVRLGDVVVGMSQKQTVESKDQDMSRADRGGGLIQYDLGSLPVPPMTIRKAIAVLRAQAEIEGYEFLNHYREMITQNPLMQQDFDRPEDDNLYQSDYVHQRGKADCSECDHSKLIEKDSLTEPRVHYGPIGSTNSIIRDALLRDSLHKNENVICLEMEAAGLMEELPCIVIRGICDYCDTHKNKSWQRYAAAMAAAYAKELLMNIPRYEVETMNKNPHFIAAPDIEEKAIPMEEKNLAFLQSLHASDPRIDKSRIENSKDDLLKDLYTWILGNERFLHWRDRSRNDGALLWIHGAPGKGKTILLCGVINELESNHDVIYFFCQADNDFNNKASAVMRGLIYMLGEMKPELIDAMRNKIDDIYGLAEDAAFHILSSLLEEMLQGLEICILVDALDECRAGLDMLLRFIVQSSDTHSIHWIVTSRYLPSVSEYLTDSSRCLSLSLNNESVSDAVAKYIEFKVTELSRMKNYDERLSSEISAHLFEKAGDSFLWVSLVCQSLASAPARHTKSLLQQCRSGLHAIYSRMMDSIESSVDNELLKNILRVMSVVFRPISLNELSVIVDLPDDVRQNPVWFKEMVHDCGGFLIVQDSLVEFIHLSANEYIKMRLIGDQEQEDELRHEIDHRWHRSGET